MSRPAGIPTDAPPDYDTATASSSTSTAANRLSAHEPSIHTERNGISAAQRRSMEDEQRELPTGWVRQFDHVEGHQFFVDTRADPPRSIWVHPYDDPDFLATLSPEERKKHSKLQRSHTLEDLAAEDTDDEGHGHNTTSAPKQPHEAELPPRPGKDGNKSTSKPNDPNAPTGIHKYTRKMKDKVTGTTHTEREAQRKQREEAERRAYETHLRARQAMVRAMETGEPQFLCKDRDGRDVYIEPPSGPAGPYGQSAYGYNPYSRGPYVNPNARFVRPAGPYGRPMGYGYGGGYGGGFGAPVAAGFLGGALLGGILF